jgi:hypothetical protein
MSEVPLYSKHRLVLRWSWFGEVVRGTHVHDYCETRDLDTYQNGRRVSYCYISEQQASSHARSGSGGAALEPSFPSLRAFVHLAVHVIPLLQHRVDESLDCVVCGIQSTACLVFRTQVPRYAVWEVGEGLRLWFSVDRWGFERRAEGAG